MEIGNSQNTVNLVVLLTIIAACSRESGVNSDEASIRAVREFSNAAIAAHDTSSMGKTLAADYTVVTSRNAVSTTRKAMLERFAADAPDVIYVRNAEIVRVYPEWKMASETGTWVGRFTNNGEKIELSGTYYAKWHKVEGKWIIRAEIFTPLTCAGGKYCDRAPI